MIHTDPISSALYTLLPCSCRLPAVRRILRLSAVIRPLSRLPSAVMSDLDRPAPFLIVPTLNRLTPLQFPACLPYPTDPAQGPQGP